LTKKKVLYHRHQKGLEESKTTLAKKKATLEQQIAKASMWSPTEVETTRKPELILRDSESFPAKKYLVSVLLIYGMTAWQPIVGLFQECHQSKLQKTSEKFNN
jgi:hypothetical protein